MPAAVRELKLQFRYYVLRVLERNLVAAPTEALNANDGQVDQAGRVQHVHVDSQVQVGHQRVDAHAASAGGGPRRMRL